MTKRAMSISAAALALTFALACGGAPSPEELAAEEEAAKKELEANGPAKFVQGKLSGEICQGNAVDLTFGLKGHEDAVAPLAQDKVKYTRWIDGGLGDANNGKVVELGPKDVDWFYALEVYCSDRATCADTSCTLDLGDSVMQIEHAIVDGEAKIVAAFKGDSLSGDKAGVAKAREAWLAEIGGAPTEPADDGGDEVAAKPDQPKPRGGGGGGARRPGGGKGRKGR